MTFRSKHMNAIFISLVLSTTSSAQNLLPEFQSMMDSKSLQELKTIFQTYLESTGPRFTDPQQVLSYVGPDAFENFKAFTNQQLPLINDTEKVFLDLLSDPLLKFSTEAGNLPSDEILLAPVESRGQPPAVLSNPASNIDVVERISKAYNGLLCEPEFIGNYQKKNPPRLIGARMNITVVGESCRLDVTSKTIECTGPQVVLEKAPKEFITAYKEARFYKGSSCSIKKEFGKPTTEILFSAGNPYGYGRIYDSISEYLQDITRSMMID